MGGGSHDCCAHGCCRQSPSVRPKISKAKRLQTTGHSLPLQAKWPRLPFGFGGFAPLPWALGTTPETTDAPVSSNSTPDVKKTWQHCPTLALALAFASIHVNQKLQPYLCRLEDAAVLAHPTKSPYASSSSTSRAQKEPHAAHITCQAQSRDSELTVTRKRLQEAIFRLSFSCLRTRNL